MFRTRVAPYVSWFLLLCASSAFAQATLPSVPAAESSTHLVRRVEPTVPPLAKALKLGGTVKLQLTISPSGEVVFVKSLSGPPMLIDAAVEAARQWKYRPFAVGGNPSKVTTEVEVLFPHGMSEDERAVRNKFFPLQNECRRLLNDAAYDAAESKCREAVALSNQLPRDAVLEKSGARSLLAHTIYLQARYAEAIPIYEDALELNQSYLKADDADLASDYWNLGRACGKSGQLPRADVLYAKAVSTFEAAILSLPGMKDNYTSRLKRCLNEYAALKEHQGRYDEAAELRKKASGI